MRQTTLTQAELETYFSANHICTEFEYREQLHELIDSSTALISAGDDRMAPLGLLRAVKAEASRRLYGGVTI